VACAAREQLGLGIGLTGEHLRNLGVAGKSPAHCRIGRRQADEHASLVRHLQSF